jgi:hypothetical protein
MESAILVRDWPPFGQGRERRYFASLDRILTPDQLVAWDRDTSGEVTEIESADLTPEYGGLLEGPVAIMLANGGFWRYLHCTQAWVCVRTSKHEVDPGFDGAMHAAAVVRGLWRGFVPDEYERRVNYARSFEAQ